MKDVSALNNLQTALNQGANKMDAISRTMADASLSARSYAENNIISAKTIDAFIVEQKQSQIEFAAQNTSLRNCDSIIKAYNSNLGVMGVTQNQFIEAVGKSNPILGKYLSTVNSGEAATKGYVGELIKAKAASIGLRVATMLLNTALTLGISLAIQGVIQLVDYFVRSQERAIEAVKDAVQEISGLKNKLKTLDEYKDKVIELRNELDKGGLSLSEVTDKRQELYDIQKYLIDNYGNEAKGIDLVTGALEKQIDTIDTLNAKESEDWLNKNRQEINTAYDYMNGKISPTTVNPGSEYRTTVELTNNGWTSSPIGFSKWLNNWVADKGYDQVLVKEMLGAESGMLDNITLEFTGNRKQIIENYDRLYSAIEDYIDTEKNLSEQDITNANALLDSISGAKNWLYDDKYKDSEELYEEAVERVATSKGVFATYYKDLSTLNERYNKAIAENDEESMEKYYKAITEKYDDIIYNGNFSDTDNVRRDDIIAYYKNQLQNFENITVPVRLKIDIEGTKQEFKSSYEDLAEMYAKVGDEGFAINSDWRSGILTVKDVSDVSVDQAYEFNAIRDAAKAAGVSIESYIEALVKYGKVKKTTASGTEELSISKYSENIKATQDAISPLLDAYNKLQKGELSGSEIVALISDKFPSLIKYTDNLSVGIQKLAGEKLEELKKKLNEVDRSKLSEDDLKAYEKFIEYIDKLNDGFKSTLAYYEKVQSQTKAVSDNITTLIGLQKEIKDNGGLSLSSMEKILSDESLASLRPYLNDVKTMLPIINGLIESQKQSYEDLYNEQQRIADPDAYLKASQQKQQEDENAFQNSVKRINELVAKFNKQYGVDLSNWDNLNDSKKSLLQNTNAELLSKQSKLIKDFADYYNTDLTNYKNTTEAKAAIYENFRKSKAFSQVTKVATENKAIGNDNGRIYLADEKGDVKKKINDILSASGLTWQDYVRYLNNEPFSSKTNEALKKTLDELVNRYSITTKTWDDATKNIGASGGSSGSSSSSSSKEKTWFEKQYAYHNHLVNMDQEKQQDYLNWLDGAYKQAYKQGIIDLDAYYKYEEEVYNGRKKLAGDASSWFEKQYKEHQHLLKMEKEGEADYLRWLDGAYKRAYAQGLISLDDYKKYQEEVYEGVKQLKDNAESAIKELINIRINMIKDEINKEKEAIDERLKNLKDFYDKQKDMLQDKYDKEKYLDEQNEKRKKVSDVKAEIEALRMDDSAKAQKRRAELAVDLKEAQKELSDFEKDHSLKEAQDQLDLLYENKEKEANKNIEALDKMASTPKELYEQALNDIRNGSQNLYNQMINWNNVYGDGIRETITKAWEEAYKAEKEYFNYTGKHFNDINLSSTTAQKKTTNLKSTSGTGSSISGSLKSNKGYASGTSHSTAGLHMVDEQGVETIFQSADGQRYRMFSSGEKVLNASASDFLYKFANKGREILDKLFSNTSHSYNNVNPTVVANNIQQGNIIIQGNADKATVSEIRRAQRDNLEHMLKQLNRLK